MPFNSGVEMSVVGDLGDVLDSYPADLIQNYQEKNLK